MAELVEDAAMRGRMSQAAQEHISGWTLSAEAKNIQFVWAELV